MNNELKSLIEVAGRKEDHTVVNWSKDIEPYIEAYTKLLIKECMLYIDNANTKDYHKKTDRYDVGYNNGLDQAILVLHEEFNVDIPAGIDIKEEDE